MAKLQKGPYLLIADEENQRHGIGKVISLSSGLKLKGTKWLYLTLYLGPLLSQIPWIEI